MISVEKCSVRKREKGRDNLFLPFRTYLHCDSAALADVTIVIKRNLAWKSRAGKEENGGRY